MNRYLSAIKIILIAKCLFCAPVNAQTHATPETSSKSLLGIYDTLHLYTLSLNNGVKFWFYNKSSADSLRNAVRNQVYKEYAILRKRIQQTRESMPDAEVQALLVMMDTILSKAELIISRLNTEEAYHSPEIYMSVREPYENFETLSEVATRHIERIISVLKSRISKEESERAFSEKLTRYGLLAASVFLILLFGFLYFIWRSRKKIITQKNEISLQHDTIKKQKELVQEKQHEIIDSINYAQRIQKALMATDQLLKDGLQDHFVFFRPRDIVSGDFYWAAALHDGKFALVTADSTGHGVPGAIMSMLNMACLFDAVQQKKLTAPAAILNATRQSVIRHLSNDGSAEGGRDGMDCNILVLDRSTNTMAYAAANNALVVVRNGQLTELSFDRMPVGRHDRDNTSFQESTFELKTGDMIYTFTDGMPDQFGGSRGKKYMYRKLKELLLRISDLSTAQQELEIKNELNSWMGDLEQVDDITVIGIRI